MKKQLSLIQKTILIAILKAESGLKFSQIKPKELENDLFNYHLQHLVKKKLIEKSDGGYILTHLGKKFVEEENPINPIGQELSLYKVNAVLVILRNHNGQKEILVQRRKRHPFYGDVHIPGGNIQKGETILAAAKRKCLEETGLIADFKNFGIVRKISLSPDGSVFRDVFLNFCITDNYSGELETNNDFGENFWANLDSAIKFEQQCAHPTKKFIAIYTFLKTHDYRELGLFLEEEIASLPR